MTISSDTASSPQGSAGEGDGLSRAFDAALESVDLDKAGFHPAAGDGEPVDLETDKQLVDAKGDEPADSAETDADKPDAKDAGQNADAAAPEPPANWDAKRKEAFAKLPPEGKTLALSMAKDFEAEFTRKSTELARDSEMAKGIRSLVTDEHRRQMAAGGIRNEVEGIARLIQLNDFATRDAPGYIRWVIGQTGLDPRQIFPEYFTGSAQTGQDGQPLQQQAPGRPAPDPQSQQVYNALGQVMTRLETIDQRNRERELETAANAINRFASETDEAGQAKRPHFDKVYPSIVELCQQPKFLAIKDMGERLARAYEAAVALDPDIRTLELDSEVQRRLAARQKQEDVAKARKARAPIRAAPTGPMAAKPKSLDGALAEAMNLHGV